MLFLDHCSDFVDRYRVLLCDVWGVLYDGASAYPAAAKFVKEARQRGCIVILISNAARLGDETVAMLARSGISDECYDAVITSGELAAEALLRRGLRKVFHIGPDRHAAIMVAAGSVRVDLDAAEVVVCSGFFGDEIVAPETYIPLLRDVYKRGLPMICANPDVVVEVGGRMVPCPGALAKLYAGLGGTVDLAGKPDICAYDAARTLAAGIAGHDLDRAHFLAIGDSMATDMVGAAGAGIDTLFVANGIHRAEVAPDKRLLREASIALFDREKVVPTAVCRELS
ncbi:MAG: hypothetical protein BGO83_03645 [Devosia sp. 66-14]|nr:MAG: hypothetical protein ABS47_09405 [Devosia sp. SCN 66-27]OJX24030.1 MAG: hypothetical protein BGO83_03645 [Devosia sp. 66-14]